MADESFQALYYAAVDAEAAFSAGIRAEYGTGRKASDMRYRMGASNEYPPALHAAWLAKRDADAAMHAWWLARWAAEDAARIAQATAT